MFGDTTLFCLRERPYRRIRHQPRHKQPCRRLLYGEVGEDTTTYAYDNAAVHSYDQAAVHATDRVSLVRHSSTPAEVEHGVTVFGPARGNIRLRPKNARAE